MGITRTVTTQVYCDVCGKWVIGWESEETGVSREWAKYHARRKGCTAGQKVICKECRIKQRIKKCSLQKKWGAAGMDGGACLGFTHDGDDEPIERCKRYACRKGKGMHAASDTLKEWLYEWNKYHPDQPLYAIKADIHHYFQSIDHAVLKTEIRKVIKDAGVLALLDRIIDHNGNMPDGVGIPVGNLTSQLFANIYLDALDQFIKHELGVEAYIRYMDDFVILSPDKEQLRSWLARIEQFLREELKLEFNPKTTILAAKNGIDFVGYKHRATHRKVRKDSIKRIKRTIKKCESGKITTEQLQKSIQSWTGHAGHADSYNLRKKIETLAEAAIEKAA